MISKSILSHKGVASLPVKTVRLNQGLMLLKLKGKQAIVSQPLLSW